MEARKAISSVLQLFSVGAFFGGGLLWMSLPFLPNLSFRIADVLIHSPSMCTSIGAGFLLVAIVLLLGFYAEGEGRVLYVRMGGQKVSIHREVLRKTVAQYFERHFSQRILFSDLHIAWGKNLEIEVFVTLVEGHMGDEMLVEIEPCLTRLLQERFGYFHPFLLVVKTVR